MSRYHKVCNGCTERHTYCRPQCEKWKKEKEAADKLNETIRKEKMLHGAFVQMQKDKIARKKKH